MSDECFEYTSGKDGGVVCDVANDVVRGALVWDGVSVHGPSRNFAPEFSLLFAQHLLDVS